jgi:hypothetical protein
MSPLLIFIPPVPHGHFDPVISSVTQAHMPLPHLLLFCILPVHTHPLDLPRPLILQSF